MTLVTQLIVDKYDKSIKNPTKFVGARYTKEEIDKLAKKLNWSIKEQETGSWRKILPSPMPEYIMHGKSIKASVDRGTIVNAIESDGIPVFNNDNDQIEGLDTVIDKDFSVAKMGRIICAQELWIISDIGYLYSNFDT